MGGLRPSHGHGHKHGHSCSHGHGHSHKHSFGHGLSHGHASASQTSSHWAPVAQHPHFQHSHPSPLSVCQCPPEVHSKHAGITNRICDGSSRSTCVFTDRLMTSVTPKLAIARLKFKGNVLKDWKLPLHFNKWTNQNLKTAMGKSLDWYQEGWENNLKVILFAHNSSIQAEYGREPQLLTEITETPPDVVEVVEPDQNTFEYYLQAQTEKDMEVFDQVRQNMDKAQEKQKESYRSVYVSVSYPVPFNSAPVLQELGVLPNTKTWIHLMFSITNHPTTFHYIIYSYCCHVIIIC